VKPQKKISSERKYTDESEEPYRAINKLSDGFRELSALVLKFLFAAIDFL
jgi:hypothetical protein